VCTTHTRVCDSTTNACVCVCVCTPEHVSRAEDTVSVDVNARPLGSGPKALSGIEFHKTSFNQQDFKVRITLSLSLSEPRLKHTRVSGWKKR